MFFSLCQGIVLLRFSNRIIQILEDLWHWYFGPGVAIASRIIAILINSCRLAIMALYTKFLCL